MKLMTTVFFLVLVSLSTFTRAEEKKNGSEDTIYWYVHNFPPVTIISGTHRGQGWADRRIQLLSQQMKEFRHETVESSSARMFEDMKTKPNACSANLLKTPERVEYIEFSDQVSWIFPNGVLTTRSRYAQIKSYLNEQGDLRLSDLLGSGKHRIGVISTRSYGKGIDGAIKENTEKGAVITVPSSNYPAGRLLKLAQQQEYDVIPGYAVELRYLTRDTGLNEQDFVFLTVAEEPSLIATYVGCSKSEFGKRVIATVNKLIPDKTLQKEDTAAYQFWLDDQTAARHDKLRRKMQASK